MVSDGNVIPISKHGSVPSIVNTDEDTIDTLTSFVKDTEYELFAVVTALQANIDLLHLEQVNNNMPVARLEVLQHAVERIVSGTAVLATVSEVAKAARSRTKVSMNSLIQEVIVAAQLSLRRKQVSLSIKIAKDVTVLGDAESLQLMFKATLTALLNNCRKDDTIHIVAQVKKYHVSFSFYTDPGTEDAAFETWRLGELRLMPTTGKGIELSAIDAMARMQGGWLSVCTELDKHKGFRLTFKA